MAVPASRRRNSVGTKASRTPVYVGKRKESLSMRGARRQTPQARGDAASSSPSVLCGHGSLSLQSGLFIVPGCAHLRTYKVRRFPHLKRPWRIVKKLSPIQSEIGPRCDAPSILRSARSCTEYGHRATRALRLLVDVDVFRGEGIVGGVDLFSRGGIYDAGNACFRR